MEKQDHREVAIALYNECWRLLEMSPRSADDDVALLSAAFTSRYHWLIAGGAEQWVISDWMVARAAAAAGYGALSVSFAQRSVDASEGLADWLVASAAEGLARAYAASGDVQRRDEWVHKANALVAAISDDEDRHLIADQLASVPR